MNLFKFLFRSKSSSKEQTTGERGEDSACSYLKKNAFRIIERNWKSKIGELDIIAEKSDTLIFVEVKSSLKLGSVPPELRVNSQKQHKLKQLARLYIKSKNISCPIRFDVIGVWWEEEVQIKHIENAFN